LFETGQITEAVRRGRQEMRAHAQRSRLNAAVKLDDWLVPVTYQQASVKLAIAKQQPSLTQAAEGVQRPGEEEERERYSFIGRDNVILELERAMLRRLARILIYGLG
jgi:hypothetical protein